MLGRLQKKSLEHNDCLNASVLQQWVRKPPTHNFPGHQNYFQTNCQSAIPTLLKRIETTLGRFVWKWFCRLGACFCTLGGLKEFHMFLMTYSSTVIVISRLELFLIMRQFSEDVLWRCYEVCNYAENVLHNKFCSLRCIRFYMHAQAHTQVYIFNLSHVQNHSIFTFVLLLSYICDKEKFFIEGFLIEHYINEI